MTAGKKQPKRADFSQVTTDEIWACFYLNIHTDSWQKAVTLEKQMTKLLLHDNWP